MTETTLQQLIDNAEPESLRLEFNAAAVLARTEDAKREITKDVSAMANADGGRIIYGIAERRDGKHRGVAGGLDPVDATAITVEWLDQLIAMIRPKIAGVTITPVPVGAGLPSVCYVVDVPAGFTAHQAIDLRYYQRSNGRAEPMYDYQIRDIMARGDHPRVVVETELRERVLSSWIEWEGGPKRHGPEVYELWVWLRNDGARLARFINGWIELPSHLVVPDTGNGLVAHGRPRPFAPTRRFVFTNREYPRDSAEDAPPHDPPLAPLLPGLVLHVARVPLNGLEFFAGRDGKHATWQIHADNAPIQQGTARLDGDFLPVPSGA